MRMSKLSSKRVGPYSSIKKRRKNNERVRGWLTLSLFSFYPFAINIIIKSLMSLKEGYLEISFLFVNFFSRADFGK